MRAPGASFAAVQWASVSNKPVTILVLRNSETLLRLILDQGRERVAAHRRVYSVAFCGRKRIIAVGSQQRMRSRHQARRGPQDCKNRAARVREAPRRILRCAHAGNETISPGGRKPPVLCRTSQHDMRATIPARASWRLQGARWRGLAGVGIRRRLEA